MVFSEPPEWFAQLLATGAEIVDEDFAGTDLRQLRIERTSFTNCRFDEASMDELQTEACSFTGCSFDRAELVGSSHLRSAFVACSFDRARLTSASLIQCKLTGSTFRDTPLRATVIDGGDFTAVARTCATSTSPT